MAPPTQAGKFKPRKQAKKPAAKKIQTPVFAAEAAGVITSASSSPSGGRGGGRGGRGGRDGGGRGGRGRGRQQRQQGAVWGFPGGASQKTPSRDERRRIKTEQLKSEEIEIVIGETDTPIGSNAKPTSILESGGGGGVKYDRDADATGSSQQGVTVGVITYDSDSSAEAAGTSHRKPKFGAPKRPAPTSGRPPLRLPFPVVKTPVGVGGTKQPFMYEDQDPGKAKQEQKDDNNRAPQPEQRVAQPASPFVDWNNPSHKSFEKDSWLLLQLPTRLPPLMGSEEPASGDQAAAATDMADVATHHIQPNSFDNSLTRTAAGRLGKIKVYKSGKTVLVLEGKDGAPDVLMRVTEGLCCGFHQQAVALDPEEGKYVALGDVNRTVVVTPDLDLAFPSECGV